MNEYKIKLIKSTFLNEKKTKNLLCDFIKNAEILSMGAECKKFEISFAKKQERKYAVFVNSGSSANLILIQAMLNLGRFKKGDIVGVSALTWATNIMPIFQLGLIPMLIDCEVETLNVSPKTLSLAIEKQPGIKGLFLTNTLGFSDDIKEVKNICDKNDMVLLEDNCEALGSSFQGKLLGNFGTASTFSFFAGHHLSTIEGGMVCTDDFELYKELVMCRAHGWDRNLDAETQEDMRAKNGIDSFFAKYTFYDLAYNVRPTEINGFIGNIQLGYWDDIVKKRGDNFKYLSALIAKNENFIPVKFEHMNSVSNFAIPIIIKDENKVDKYKKEFSDSGVEIRPMIAGNMATQPFFKKYSGITTGGQPNAEFIHKNSFYFGNNPELNNEDLNILAGLISSSF